MYRRLDLCSGTAKCLRSPAAISAVVLVFVLLGPVGCGPSEESREQYELGRRLGQEGKLDEAIAAFKQSIAADPKNPDGHNGLGYACLLLHREQDAEKHFKEALRLQPDHSKALRHLATLYQRQERMEEAIPLWEKLTEIDPYDAQSWSYLSSAYFATFQIEKALVASKRAIGISPNDPAVIVNHANMQKHLTKLDEAEKYYKKVVDMKSPDKQIRLLSLTGLFDVYFLQGENAKAKVLALQAEEEFPDDYRIAYNLAVLYERLGDEVNAERYYNRTSELSSGNAAVLSQAAKFFHKTNKIGRAKELFKDAIKANPEYIEAYLGLMDLLMEQSDGLTEAEELGKTALSHADDLKTPRVLDSLATVKRLQKDYEASLEYSEKALEQVRKGDLQSEAMLRLNRSRTLKEKGDFASAKSELEAILALGPPENIMKMIELVASELPSEWVPDLGAVEQQGSQEGSN